MNRFLVFILIASFFVACVERADVTPTKRRNKTSTTSETNDAELPGDDDDTTLAKAKPEPTETDKPPTKTETAPAPIDPFAGAPAFAGDAPAKDSTEHHQGYSNAGKECMSCHGPGKGAPSFALGGTIQTSKTSSEGASGVEVRVVDEKGTQIAMMTSDSAGNFWFPGTTPITGGSKVAIRVASGAQKMSGAIATGSCNSAGCHTKDRPIFLAN